MLELEEEFVRRQCDDIIALKPDVVFTEKGVSDIAQHFLLKAGISAVRRVRKSDNNRIARACGATIVNRTEELQESDIGTGAGLFEIKKIGDEYFCFIAQCKNPKVSEAHFQITYVVICIFCAIGVYNFTTRR